MGIFSKKGSLRKRSDEHREKVEKIRKMTEEEQSRLMQEKLDQIGQTMHKLRVSERLLENNVARQRQIAIRARNARPRNEAKFLREIRKLEFYLTYQWYTEDMIDALDEKQTELQTALDMKDFQTALNNADGLLGSAVVDIDELLNTADVASRRSSSLASIDAVFERALKSRTGSVENPLSEDYIERLLSDDVTAEDFDAAHSAKPAEERTASKPAPSPDEADERFERLSALFDSDEA